MARKNSIIVGLTAVSVLALLPESHAYAQNMPSTNDPETLQSAPKRGDVAQPDPGSSGLGDIVVTATKRGQAENVQAVPFAVTAFGTKQLDDQHVRNLQNLSYSAPNVQLESVGTSPGYANFSIRGLGITSSIPSIDPTVGVFVDGIYLGISAGVLFDTFDLAGVEILRGPQGLLFGRNVTGGAVVVRTTTPDNNFHVDGRVAVESGLNKIVSGVVSGPLVTDKLSAKIGVYYDKDDGYFTNKFNNNRHFGKNDTLIFRSALRFTPSDDVEFITRYEHGRTRGDGTVASNLALFGTQGFGISVNEEGVSNSDWDQAILETNIKTSFGSGTITNIAGYRAYKAFVTADIDASPNPLLGIDAFTQQHQFSDELRYAGTFGIIDLTGGLYFFDQYINYIEKRRIFNGALIISGGGVQNQKTYGSFVSTDVHVSDTITLNAGIRYSYEKKRVNIATITKNLCDPLTTHSCSSYDFNDSHSWQDPTFRVGAQWKPTGATQVYGYYARGFRSGGYNFRNVNIQVTPGPFDSEKQDAFEIGLKQQFGQLLRLNLAAFHNNVYGLQREINTPVLPAGGAAVIRNTANARINGVEGEALLRVDRHLTLSGQFGYTDAKYTKILYDLTGDGVVGPADLALKPPRVAPWSYGGAIDYRRELGQIGEISTRISYEHRDPQFSNDANTGVLNGANMIDADISFTPLDTRWRFSIYGRNLKNQETQGAVAPLPFFKGDTYAAINKGRIYGGEITFKF